MKAVYFEDHFSHCNECRLFEMCSCEGKCACDVWREKHDPDCEGDYYFVDDEEGGEG